MSDPISKFIEGAGQGVLDTPKNIFNTATQIFERFRGHHPDSLPALRPSNRTFEAYGSAGGSFLANSVLGWGLQKIFPNTDLSTPTSRISNIAAKLTMDKIFLNKDLYTMQKIYNAVSSPMLQNTFKSRNFLTIGINGFLFLNSMKSKDHYLGGSRL